MSRLFVAVWPPPNLLDGLRQMDRPQLPGIRWTTEDQWHVTLQFLGDVDDAAGLSEGLEGVADRCEPVFVRAGPRPRSLGGHVWVLPVEGLPDLALAVHGAIGDALDAGMSREPRPFRGHITLARARRGGSFRGLASPEVSASWTVDEITLVSSDLHPRGARYTVVGRWRLHGAD